jgi:hypothetical protein
MSVPQHARLCSKGMPATRSLRLSWFWPQPAIGSQLIDNLNASIGTRDDCL